MSTRAGNRNVETSGAEREGVSQRVAAYKYPRGVWIVDGLPKAPSGKIAKREIQVPHDVGLRI